MPFDLTIGTERAQTLQVRAHFETRMSIVLIGFQNAIQEELAQRGYSADAGACSWMPGGSTCSQI